MSTYIGYRLTKGHLVSELGEDEIVVLQVKNGQYYSLEGVGAFIWRRLENGSLTLDQLVSAVTTEYDTDATQCRNDLETFLSEMCQQGLFEEIDEAN